MNQNWFLILLWRSQAFCLKKWQAFAKWFGFTKNQKAKKRQQELHNGVTVSDIYGINTPQ